MKIERAVIEINGGCNYTCKMCPQTNSDGTHGARGKNWLKKMTINQFEDIVAQCAEVGLKVVNLEGSGEPTLNSDLPKYIEIVKKYNAKSFIFSNGLKMTGTFMKDVINSGLDFFRFSVIGYDEKTYQQWMNSPFFKKIISNIHESQSYVSLTKSSCVIGTYHLILDHNNIEYEKERYLSLVNDTNIKTEIWKMHNWANSYKPNYTRIGAKRSCGRPFSPDIVVRAGGIDNKNAAVHPCCQVLGRDDEAVLGHLSEYSLKELWHNYAYTKLREDHSKGNFPDFCKNCDFLLDDREVLIYSNHTTNLYQMHGTSFKLSDYQI